MKHQKIISIIFILICLNLQSQTLLDVTVKVDSRNSNWQSTGITIETGDYLYLFAWGAVITHGTSMGNKIGAYLVGSDNTKGDNMLPYASSGLGVVMKVGENEPWPVGQVFRGTHWTGSSGELSLGFNDNAHYDNQGSMIVGILRIRDLDNPEDLLDTSTPVNAWDSNWQPTGITIETEDYLYLFAWGAVITHGTSMGNKIGAYLVGSDNTKGDNMLPYANSGLGVVMKVGENEPWPVGQVFRGTYWTGNSGELSLGFNDNAHYDNDGSMVVGILKIRNITTGLFKRDNINPENVKISQNYPNPFNPNTQIDFSINKSGNINLSIYNQAGKMVRTLINETKSSGYYSVSWDGKDNLNNLLSSGVYEYRIMFDGSIQSKKMLLIK